MSISGSFLWFLCSFSESLFFRNMLPLFINCFIISYTFELVEGNKTAQKGFVKWAVAKLCEEGAFCSVYIISGLVNYSCKTSSSSNNLNGYRSSRPELFCKKGVLKNFGKFTGKLLYQSLFTLALVFSCEFCEISKNSFSYRTPLVAASVVVL